MGRIYLFAFVFVLLLAIFVGPVSKSVIGVEQCNPATWLDEDSPLPGPFGGDDDILEVYTRDGEWLNVAPVRPGGMSREDVVYTLCAERRALVTTFGWGWPFRRTIIRVEPA